MDRAIASKILPSLNVPMPAQALVPGSDSSPDFWLAEDLRHCAILLFDQQMWCWGCDIRHPAGNVLKRFGFTRRGVPEGQRGSSQYSIGFQRGEIRLWGWGVLYITPDMAVFVRRFEFAPQWRAPRGIRNLIWMPEQIGRLRAAHRKAKRCMMQSYLAELCLWTAEYERWVQATCGFSYRTACLEQWHKPLGASADQIAITWESLGEGIQSTSNNSNRTSGANFNRGRCERKTMQQQTKKLGNAQSHIYVIGGFLGSGKTTLLKRLIKSELDRGVRPGVLMNEFGGSDVDSLSLCPTDRADEIKLEAILHGTLCADCAGAVNESLQRLLGEVRGAPLFIETTGVACTGQMIDSVRKALARQSGAPAGYIVSSIVVVDTPRFEAVMNTWSEAVNHLRDADTVILNKIDSAKVREIEHAESRVRRINPGARIIKTSFADVEADDITPHGSLGHESKELLDEALQTPADCTPTFRSLTVDVLNPIDLARVENLFNRYRVSLLRAKGFVHSISARQIQEIQWVPGSFAVRPYQHQKPVRPHIAMIGRRVPWQRVFEQLAACVLSPTPCPQN